MKYLGIAGIMAFAAWAAGTGFEGAAEAHRLPMEVGSGTDIGNGGKPSDFEVGGPEVLGEALPAGVLEFGNLPQQEVPSTRTRRSRGRNRYPGPIPTPAVWEPPEGPVRIGLQAGHWKADEAPRELSGLRENGTAWRGTAEWEVNLAIAEATAGMLREIGYEVDLLPAVVPPSYRAHLFIAIHADGSNDPNASGFRVAAPSRDATGRASGFAGLLEGTYGAATSLRRLPTITRRMRNYYAFNFRRYEHALHPMTIGVIIETGFITSTRDRGVILSEPEQAAQGIVNAITAFPITPPPQDSTRAGMDTAAVNRQN